MTEAELHKQAVSWLRWDAPDLIFYHPANGEARDPRTGAKLNGLGVLPGVADLAFVLPGGRAAFIELKAQRGRMSPAQREFGERVIAAGGDYAVCRSLEDVRAALSEWSIKTKARSA